MRYDFLNNLANQGIRGHIQTPSVKKLDGKSKNGNPLSNDRTVDFNTPLRPLQNRYTPTGTLFRWGMAVTYSRYKFMAVSLPKRLWYCRFGSETAGFGSETAT